jgi:hypothetical protein
MLLSLRIEEASEILGLGDRMLQLQDSYRSRYDAIYKQVF